MKKKEILKRVKALEGRVVEVPTSEMDWATTVDKFKELEMKIQRIEALERQMGLTQREMLNQAGWFTHLEKRLDNLKGRITGLERARKAGLMMGDRVEIPMEGEAD